MTQEKNMQSQGASQYFEQLRELKENKCCTADWCVKSLAEPWALIPHPSIFTFEYMTSMTYMTKRFPALKLINVFLFPTCSFWVELG